MVPKLIKSRFSRGVRQAWHAVGEEIRLEALHRAGVKKAKTISATGGLKLNAGCGPNVKQGWINVDLSP